MSDKKVVLGNAQAKKDASTLKSLSMRLRTHVTALRAHALDRLAGDKCVWDDAVSAQFAKRMEAFVIDFEKAADKLEECANDMETIASSIK